MSHRRIIGRGYLDSAGRADEHYALPLPAWRRWHTNSLRALA